MPIRLVSKCRGEGTLAEAIIGTRLDLAELERKIVSTMIALLRRGVERCGKVTLAPVITVTRARDRFLFPAYAEGWLRRTVHKWQNRLLVEQWGIGRITQSACEVVNGQPLAAISWIDGAGFGNLADPHPWPGTDRILCEEFAGNGSVGPTLGTILAIKVDARSRITEQVRLLGEPFHRSYPGAVVNKGRTILLPETPERGQTALYHLLDSGALERICLVSPRLRMADPTLFWHGGFAWIAYTNLDFGEHDNLCFLYARDVAGPWREHENNPVKIDIRSARPAGPVIRHNGALYRPAQDCARSYGAAVVLHRIITLTTSTFEEVAIRRFVPDASGPFPDGIHTFSCDGNTIFVDGKRCSFSFARFAKTLRHRMAPPLKRPI
jgi:hypothetical protein